MTKWEVGKVEEDGQSITNNSFFIFIYFILGFVNGLYVAKEAVAVHYLSLEDGVM